MGNLINKLKQADDAAVFGQIDDREQAVVDRHRQKAPGGFRRRLADADAKAEIDTRRQQRAYAEQAPPEVIQPAKEMLTNLGDRQKVLETFRKLSPEQRQEALKLAPGLAQQLGDDRGGAVGRTLGAVSRGISHGVSQPISELIGTGGTPEEIEYIRQLDAAASQEFSPARPGDPWYQSGPLQAAEMAPWMATVVGGAGVGRAIATGAAKPVAAQMATRAGLGRATLNAAGKAGELAGITAASFPPQYAQEVDQLKEIGMQDGTQLRLLAAGTAAITGLVEGIVPNPFKTGPVPLTEGAVKAARSYLWEAAKRAPGEMSEEYLQGVTSGLGKTVAGYLDENAEDKSVADAFKNGWEQAKEAALPMAFLLGVPAIGGAGLSAARAQRLQQAMAKGFVSSEDAKELGIVGKNRPERMANAQAELEQLNRPTVGQMPPSGPPALPEGTASPDLASPPGALPPTGAIPPAMPPAVQPPRIPGPTQVKPPLPVPSTPTPGTATPPAATEAGVTPKVIPNEAETAKTKFDTYVESAWNRDTPVSDSYKKSQKQFVSSTADYGIKQGRVVAFDKGDGSTELQFAAIAEELEQRGYQAGPIQKSRSDGIDNIEFSVTKKAPVEPPKQVEGKIDDNQLRIFKDGKWRDATVTAVNEGDDGWRVKHVKVADPETGQYEYVPFPSDAAKGYSSYEQARDDVLAVLKEKYKEPSALPAPQQPQLSAPKPADPVSELDQAEDELAGLFGEEETPTPPKPTEKPPKAATSPTTQPGWEIVESDGGKLFRENQDPNLKPSQRISTRVAVDPSENVLATKDRFGKPIPPEILAARQEFVDKAKPGAEFEIKGFPGQTNTVQDDGSLLNTSDQGTKRVMGNVQSRANQVKPGDITWKETPRATPTPAAPAVDAETKGAAATPKEATVDREPIKLGDHVRVEGTDIAGSVGAVQTSKGVLINDFNGGSAWHPVEKVRATERKPDFVDELVDKMGDKKPAKPDSAPAVPESKWSSEIRAKLEAVPALKGAKIETAEKAGRVRVTRPDGLQTVIYFDADKTIEEAAKARGRKPESVHGWYIREPGKKRGQIYIHSKANHTNILNHEVMHWLEDTGVVTKDEVEAMGGREAIAEKYGKWVELKQRKKNGVFQRIYDALEPLFSSQARFFEEVGKRGAETKAPQPSYAEQLQKNYIKQKRALTKAKGTEDPRKILEAAEQGLASFEQFGEPDDWSSWVRAKDDAEQAIKRAEVSPIGDKTPTKPQENLSQDKKPSVQQPPAGYKPLKEFTPTVTQTQSPDLELQDNRNGIKELGLKEGDAVGYRVYPKRGSLKGGYWKYGTVQYDPSGSHASIKLADGTTEMVGGSRLRKLESMGEQDTGTKVGNKPTDFSISGQSKPIPGMEAEEATYTVHARKPDVIPDTFSVVVAGKPRGKGWSTFKGTGMSPEEAYDRAVRMFMDKRAAETTKPSADQVNVDSGAESKVKAEPEPEGTAADFDAEMEKLMAGLAEPESGLTKPPAKEGGKRPPRKPSAEKKPTAKPTAKTAEDKSADDRARAAAKKEEAKRKMREAFEDTQGRPLSGFDPQIGMKVAQATKLYIEAGALDFRAFVRDLVTDFGKAWVEGKAPYFESAWRTANKLKWVDSPTGNVADVLAEQASNYGTLEAPNRVELGKHFQQQLESGKDYKSIVEARKEAATLIAGEGASIEPGTPAAKAIDEAVEQGVVRAARSLAESSSDPLKVYDNLLDLYERQPRLAVRTGTSMRQQAYSTPAPAAWIATILSDTKRDNTAYDSSAGNGMLLLGVDPENAMANEINTDRADALRALGYDVHEGDATEYTPDTPPERIIINPPFGEDVEGKTWNIGGTTTDKIDHAIVLKTLESLPEDGKAVLIIGSKGFEQRKAKDELRRGEAYKNDKNFYNALYDGYNVTDHFTLHGDLYAKQGAAFPIDVIVIDGRGQSELPKPYQIDRQNAIPRVINSWKELRDVGERYLDTGSGRPSDLSTEPVGDDMAGLSSLLEGQGERTGGKGGRSGKNTGGRGGVPSGGTDNTQQPRGDSGSSSVSGAPDESGSDRTERLPDDNQPGATTGPDGGNDVKKLDREADVGSEDGLQLPYSQRSSARNVGTLVPATHARAVQEALEKTELRYGNLDEFVAKELGYKPKELMNYFSAEQIDALALNIARHKEGKAFVLGDQTGVGKGRVAAATMVYAKRQGLVPVFMTQSPDLFADMYRDLQDIGQHSEGEPFYALATNTLTGKDKIELPDGTMITQTADFAKDTINEVARNVANDLGPIAMITVQKTTDADGNPLGTTPTGRPRVRSVQEQREYDAVFSTYSQMQTVGGDTKDRHTAMSLIASKSFFVLDESHNAGGVKARSSGRGNENESADAVGRAARLRELVSESQGVLFLSATYAKNPDVMDLYAKTGMADAVEGGDEALIETINKGGIPLQQVLSEMLVESGAYMRREKSFDGIEFSAVVKETGREEAGEIAGIFDSINNLDKIKNDIVDTEAFKRWLTAQGLGLGNDSATGRRGMESSTFSSIVHNLVDQMLLSVKADAVADEAIAALKRNESPVIALSNTAGAALDNYLSDFPAEVGDEIEFGFNSTAYRYLERSREIMLTDVDASGKKTSRRVRLPDDVLGPDGMQAYNTAKTLIDNFAAQIPASPIDHIRNRIEKAGYTVSEITGRDMMVDYSGNKMRLAKRPSSEQGKSGKLTSVRGYNSGEIDVLILNQSGSTGLSAHASSKFTNQKRRHMIVAQADKNIDTFMQMLGRINRTGQVEQHKGQPKGSNLPRYMLLMTDVPAEIRPASVLIKKLSSLNANVTADSKGSVSFDAPDILNKVGDRVVAEYVADNPALNHALDDIVEVNAEGSPKVLPDIARKVSGRMAMRPIPEQQAFWDAVTETYAEEIEQLNKLGKNPLAATKLDLGARTLERVEIFSGDTTADSPFLQPAYADRALVKKQGEPMTPDEIKTEINEFYGLRVKRKRGPDPFGDMAAEMFRESMTGKDAPQNVTVSQPNLRQAIMNWSSEQIAKAEEAINEKAQQQIARLVNQEAIDRVRSRASTIETTIRRRLNSIAPGMAVAVSEMQEGGTYSGSITGVVIDVKAKKGNEHLPSGWVATIAISSPDRVVRVPFSRIEAAGQAGDMYVAPMFEVARDLTYAEWEEIGDVYEERVIGTGNVLAAFDKLVSEGDRGNIVFFTNEEGVSQRGVLMPRSFNFDRWAEKRPATFKAPEQVFEFINLEQGQLNHQANDPNFAIQFVMDGPFMLVRSPRSRQRSGKYTTNQELIAASGTDFVSVGQILQMKVRGKQQQLAVIKAALKLGPLVAANFKEDAKAVISRLPATQDASTKTKLQQAAERANQELSDAEKVLRDTLRGKLGANLLINPQVVAAAANVVAKAIKAGTLNFAELMERMITKYGQAKAEQMRAVLQQEWNKQVNARPYSEDGTPPTSPQPHPELVAPEPIPLTSVKNAIVDELRIQRGETPMPDVMPQTVQQWLEVAGNRIANDPYAGNTLVEQLLTGGKTSVDEMEGMVLQYHYRAVNNLFGEADIKLRQAKANGDPAAIAIAQDEARVLMRRLAAIETALDKAGTAWGRAGVSRQVFLKQDFSLGSMVRRARVANGGSELSNEQVASISEQADKIEKLQKQIAELEAKAAEQEQTKVIDDAIKTDVEDTKRQRVKAKSKMRIEAEARVTSAIQVFSAAAKGKLYFNPTDPQVLIPAIDVVKAYFDLGVVTFREFMSTVAKSIGAKEAKSAEPTFRTAWDQLRTAGVISQPSLDINNPGQLTRFARNVQRTLIENGVTEREEIVDAVHEALQEIIPEITRRQAMDALSSYGQFSQLSKDPIDQIMRDINGQLQQLAKLEDMEQGIAPAKTGVERRSQSDEERRLTQMVNEAKRRGGFVVTDPETQLKSAMAAAKTAVRNRIADMTFELTPKPDGTYSRIVRGKTELIPDAELEQLRKERDELQKVHKEMFPPKGATQAQKIASASRALDAAIASLEAKLAVGDISPAPQPTPLSTPELDAKRARLKQLNAQRDALRKIANPGMTAEQVKIRALDKSIAELEKQLATGNFAPKPKSAPLTSPEINARQAKLEELRATKKAILAAANPKMTPEQRAARAYEAHLRKQLAIYMEKIAQGDFAPTPKKQPRVLTKAELDLKKQLADVKNDFFEALAKYHLENLSPGERAIDAIRESAHLSRAIMTSVDLSAVLRQGGLGVYSHPVMAKKAAAEMWQAIWSREAEFQSIEKLRMRPNAQLYEESGLNITDSEGKLTRQEEAFMGRWARTGVDFAGEKVQALSKLALEPVAASARAYVTFINNLRADLFDVMVENLGPGGQVTKEEAQVIASYINVATGRSDWKKLNEWAANMNTVFFAPRYVASRFQYLAMPFYVLGSRKNSGRVKKLIAQEYARTFTGAAVFIGSLTAIAYLAAGGDDEEEPSVELNPLSSDFAKVRIGETRIDPMAGLAQVIVFSSRMAAFNTKNSVTGKVKPFYDGGRYETTHLSEAWRFTRTKLAPVPGAVVTAFSGMENVVGEDVTPAGLVTGLFVPISAGEFLSTMEHRGIPKGLALNVLNLLGASVNTYGPKTAYLDATPEERTKMVNEYIKTMNWESDLPAFSQYLKPEELKQVQNRQDERRGDLVFEAMGTVLPKKDYKTEVHFEEAQERLDKANKEFEEFRKQYAPTVTDAIRYLTHHFDSEGGIKMQGTYKLKPSFKERRARLEKHYQSLPQ